MKKYRKKGEKERAGERHINYHASFLRLKNTHKKKIKKKERAGPQQATIAPPLYSLKIYIKKREKREERGRCI